MSYDEICTNPPELESAPEDNVFISKEPQIEIAEKKVQEPEKIQPKKKSGFLSAFMNIFRTKKKMEKNETKVEKKKLEKKETKVEKKKINKANEEEQEETIVKASANACTACPTEEAKPPTKSSKTMFGSFRKSNRVNKKKTFKGKNAEGTVYVEETSNKEVWQNIIDNSLLGTHILTKAAICNMSSGGLFAYGPEDFTPTVEQIGILVNARMNPKQLHTSGISIADERYNFSSAIPEQYMVGLQPPTSVSETGPPYASGVLVFWGHHYMLIGVYKNDQEAAIRLCNEMVEYFKSQLSF